MSAPARKHVRLGAGLLGLLLALSLGPRPVTAQDATAGNGRASTPAANSPSAAQGVVQNSSGAPNPNAADSEVDEKAEYRQSTMVKKLGGMLGLTSRSAANVFDWLNFGVLFALVAWFLARALPKLFRNRTSALQKHLVDARAAQEEASARMNSIEDRLAALDGQIATMQVEADKASAADEARIKASVEEDKVKIVAAAEAEIAAAGMAARRDLQRYAAELAIEQAARKLVISAETDRLLVQGFARKLGGGDVTGGGN